MSEVVVAWGAACLLWHCPVSRPVWWERLEKGAGPAVPTRPGLLAAAPGGSRAVRGDGSRA